MSLKMVSWCRIRCDIRSYLSVVYSSFSSGVEQIVGVVNRDLMEAARLRFVPFVNAAGGTIGSGKFKAKGTAESVTLAAFFMTRARGMSVSDSVFWSNRPLDAVQVRSSVVARELVCTGMCRLRQP